MKKNVKIIIIVLAALAIVLTAFVSNTLGLGGFLSKAGWNYAKYKSNDKVVATINGKPIYFSNIALQYLSAKSVYKIQLPEFEKHFPQNYEQFISKPDPFKILNADIDYMLLSDYVKKSGIKIDEDYAKNFIDQQRKEFFYLINGMPQSELNKMTKADREVYAEFGKIVKDVVKTSGMSPEDFFKKAIPVYKNSILVKIYERQMENNIKVPDPTPEEIENYMKTHKGCTKEEAASSLMKQKAHFIMESKINNLISQLKQQADIKILNKEVLENLIKNDP